jgi:hypothetical protein
MAAREPMAMLSGAPCSIRLSQPIAVAYGASTLLRAPSATP